MGKVIRDQTSQRQMAWLFYSPRQILLYWVNSVHSRAPKGTTELWESLLCRVSLGPQATNPIILPEQTSATR